MLSTREAYGLALAEFGEKYNFYVVDADLAKSTQTAKFAQKFPERFIDVGIAESNLMSFAAGFSSCGVPVFASTFAMFAAGRAFEQVRNSIVYSNCNVKIGATHGGILMGEDGASHQCIEDLSLMRALPGMAVMCPSDAAQARACVKAALDYTGPVYMRFGRSAVRDIYAPSAEFTIGKGNKLKEGSDVTLAGIGDMVARCLDAAKILEDGNISAAVLDLASVKPIDGGLLDEYAAKTGCFVTAEDHNIYGGLGSAVSEHLAKHRPCPVEMIGLQDTFGRSGKPAELAAAFGLEPAHIAAAARKVISRKTV